MSEEITSSIMENYESIRIASQWESKFENPDSIDRTYNAFIEVMTYRREIAIRILKEENEKNRKMLIESYEICNDQICKILGLKIRK